MKSKVSVKALVLAALLALSASSSFAKLNPAYVTGSFEDISLGSFEVFSLSNVSGSFGYATSMEFPGFGSIPLGKVTFDGGTVGSYSLLGNSFSLSNVAAGIYSVFASGSVEQNSFGLIGAIVNVTPVPEPETYAMLLAGLGVMGGIARRRMKTTP